MKVQLVECKAIQKQGEFITILGQALSVVVLERLRSHQLMGQVL